MNTCSNCGADVRPGAKFCTACGTRLNDVAAADASSAWTSGQSAPETADESDPSTDTGASPASADANVDLPAANGSTESDTATASSPSEDASSSWSWRSSPDSASSASRAEDDDDRIDPPSAAAEPRVVMIEKDDQSATSSPAEKPSTDEFTWTWGAEDERSEASGIDADRDTGDEDRVAASRFEDSWNGDGASGGDAATTATAPADETPESAEIAEDDVDPESASNHRPAHQPADDAGTPSDEDPLDHARRLIDELQTLIPPPRPYRDDAQAALDAPLEELRDSLSSARSSSDFDELRTVLESARERPRDIDTMLEMVSRIDTMLAALDDRDRLASAIDRAIDQLQPDASGSTRNR